MSSSPPITLIDPDLHEITLYSRDTYTSLAAAKVDKAVRKVNIEDLTGNMYNRGSLLTALELVNTVLDCIGGKPNIAYIVTDTQGNVVDAN